MTRAQADFSALADGLCRVLEPGEHLMLSYSGEESDFVRLNHARIRQAGRVAQQSVVLDLIADGRHASAQRLLGGDPALDLLQLSEVLVQLRRERSGLDPDPHLLLCEASQGSVRQDEDRLPDSAAAVQTLIACAQGLDLVGLWCAGGIQRGFASSFGQRSWHSVHTFHASWSCHLQGDRATAGRYAGTTFEPAELTRRLAATRAACTALARQPAAILPGRYRAFLAPAAVQELVGMLCWGGFSLKAHRTGTTPLLRLGSLEARLHQAVTMSEDRSQGLAPSFTATGFPLPERVPLVDGGRLAGLLVGPRSAREFALPLNAGEESPESLVMAGGELDQAEILELFEGDAGVGQLQLLDLGEVGLVLGVGARPAAFDVGDSEPVEGFGEGELVRQAEVDALALRAVTQGGVVDLQGACPAIGSGGGGRGAHGVSVSVRVLGGAFT